MRDIKKGYKIIRFTPDATKYEAKSISDFDYAVDYNEVDIPMGKSRIGGPVVDLPKNVEYPTELYFVAQINLNEFKDYFINDYLPNKGFLYFFCDDYMENGRVIYSESTVAELKRVVKEHDNQFFQGCLVKDIYIERENINERYDEEWAKEGEKVGWNPFIGFEKSKLFGLYNNCQYEEEEIKEELSSTKILLLQIGEDFTEEGILSVRIEEKDLLNRKFQNCIFEWSQS
ncbi:DUF1963 domain-containing protein [Dethiothermospora halolimnae]|uniref:DUF1963 domain-containing protein n=1 Tax=Dethiothermospora halolimnae TaxID=3114390 RepID=UPI003CCBBA60